MRAISRMVRKNAGALSLPLLVFLLPAGLTLAYYLGGEVALITLSAGLPMGVLVARLAFPQPSSATLARDSVTGLILRNGFDDILAQTYDAARPGDLHSALFLVELDEADEILSRMGQPVIDDILKAMSDRITGLLRVNDTVARAGDTRFAICLQLVRYLNLESCIQLAGRLQTAMEQPIPSGGATIHVTCTVAFCLQHRAPGETPQDWISATETALEEARRNGPGTIRAFNADLAQRHRTRTEFNRTVAKAVEDDQIDAWFQPQLCTATGRVSGFEALARWIRPGEGAVSADQFVPALEAQGMLERMSDAILHQALRAVRGWDAAGLAVPQVGVNLSQQDLTNPRLCEKLSWELDRFDIAANRLSIEILESVVCDAPDDLVARNIDGLQKLGCSIDLDDFGTGQTSLMSLRRFPVSRIKIDRSFVTRADQDPEQQRMIGALVSLAEQLNLDTLAEGVETVGEHAYLAQIGCTHVQGFAIARPMPFDSTLDWLRQHARKLPDTSGIVTGRG